MDDIDKKLLEDKSYPDTNDIDFQKKLYEKREMNMYYQKRRKTYSNFEEKKKILTEICKPKIYKYKDSQILLSNYLNPTTPYKGLLAFHGVGVGKSIGATAIAEGFKINAEKYNTKIYIFVPGPMQKQSFYNEIIKGTGDTYYKSTHDFPVTDSVRQFRETQNAILSIKQYYNIMTHRSFYRKVLGDKVKEKKYIGNKIIISNKRDSSGNIIRDKPTDILTDLDNTLAIFDEVHGMTQNGAGEAIQIITKNSKNLKILLMTATPMINYADEILELINYLRPIDDQIEKSRVFTGTETELKFKVGGEEYLRDKIRGYVSYLRGAEPLTFAKRIDNGVTPDSLQFLKVIQCYPSDFQLQTYNEIVNSQTFSDSLDIKSSSAANFSFPGFTKNLKDIQGYCGIKGIKIVREQLKNNRQKLCELINAQFKFGLSKDESHNLIYLINNNKTIYGNIFHYKYVENFSCKLKKLLDDVGEFVEGKKGSGPIFIYSNVVKTGIDIVETTFSVNGYLKYQEDSNYIIEDNTKCYCCNENYSEHAKKNHKFYPAVFMKVTGQDEDSELPEQNIKIINEVLNNVNNSHGKNIKFILGSKVMGESFTLKNCKASFMVDVYYNLGKYDQVIGRTLRYCVHYDVTTEKNQEPTVEINRYVMSVKDDISREELLYKKAEIKYQLVKHCETILKEEAVDCPLNYNANVFLEEIEKSKNCTTATCLPQCGYRQCLYKCSCENLNKKYYDEENKTYRKPTLEETDFSTHTNELAKLEINDCKNIIKKLYKLDFSYTLEEILEKIKEEYSNQGKDSFNEFFVFRALDDLIPIGINDLNNFTDVLRNKFNAIGYLIYRDGYYIFQENNKPEDLPMNYRKKNDMYISNKITLNEFVSNQFGDTNKINNLYDFENIQDYYNSKPEFEYVGIIDKKSSKEGSIIDIFKIRPKRPLSVLKKRETGLPSYKGAVCNNAKDKKELKKMSKKIGIIIETGDSRDIVCKKMNEKLYDLEKYSTTNDNNKFTYLIVPINHESIQFPLNLEDRVLSLIERIKNELFIATQPKIICKKINNKSIERFSDINYVYYDIIYDESMSKHERILLKYGFKQKDKEYILRFE